MSSIDNLLSKFQGVKSTGKDRWQAICPAHADKVASLSMTLTSNRALIFCHAGCQINDILKSADLTFADLFFNGNSPVSIYQYRKSNGSFSHEKLKYIKADGSKKFSQRTIGEDGIVDSLGVIKRIPYNFPDVLKVIKQGSPLLYVEGERDADTAKLLGYTATTMGGASDWKDEYKVYFKNAYIIQIPDKDEAGLKLATKVTTSLKEVTKSLRVLILPEGKDLTEWVEKGNSDLASVIAGSELVKEAGIPNPSMLTTLSGYTFSWDELGLVVKIERLNDDAEGIIIALDNDRVIHTSKINLLSTRSLSELSKRLEKSKKVDWDTILSRIASLCTEALRGGGEDENINLLPTTMLIEYLLEPILPLNEPVTIYTAGGKGKSIFADYLSVLVQFGIVSAGNLPFLPRQANVLYLDWEADSETHRRYITAIKRGLNITDTEPIIYRKLDHPLSQIIDTVRIAITKYNIGLVIIDSQMAATASGTRGLTEAQVASEYYNLIRSFGCSTLTIDHITKQGMVSDGGAEAPYGSIVKYNRSRSQFELKLPDDDEDSDHKEYALIHRKFNLGRKEKPLGITVDFTNNDKELEKIEFSQCHLEDNPLLSKSLPQWRQISQILKEKQPLTSTEIALELDNFKMPAKRVNDLLKRYNKLFVLADKKEKRWGLLHND